MPLNQNDQHIHLFTSKISVRWRDVDPFGMVNHSVFFTVMEEARLKWFATTGLQQTLKYIYPIVNANITFKNTILYPADVIIKLYTNTIREKSWVFYHEILNEQNPDEIHAHASLVSMVYDPKLKCSVSIPPEMIEALQKSL